MRSTLYRRVLRYWWCLVVEKRVITVDIEIAKPVESHPDKWAGAMRGECGISSMVLFDTATMRYHVYMPEICIENGVVAVEGLDNLHVGLKHLNEADIIVGWNNTGFDRRVIESLLGKIDPIDYDLLTHIWKARGREKGWSLGPTAQRTLGINKTESGAHAPDLFQSGKIGRLVDYNISDVYITRMLVNHVVDGGHLIAPDGSEVAVTPLECYA